MQTIVLGAIALLSVVNPLLLIWVWSQKVNPGMNADEGPKWRTFLLWIGLPAATVAVVTFWWGIRYAPTTSGQDDLLFTRFVRVSFLTASIGWLAAVAGKGEGRRRIALRTNYAS
jgi:hypothetical protein